MVLMNIFNQRTLLNSSHPSLLCDLTFMCLILGWIKWPAVSKEDQRLWSDSSASPGLEEAPSITLVGEMCSAAPLKCLQLSSRAERLEPKSPFSKTCSRLWRKWSLFCCRSWRRSPLLYLATVLVLSRVSLSQKPWRNCTTLNQFTSFCLEPLRRILRWGLMPQREASCQMRIFSDGWLRSEGPHLSSCRTLRSWSCSCRR